MAPLSNVSPSIGKMPTPEDVVPGQHLRRGQAAVRLCFNELTSPPWAKCKWQRMVNPWCDEEAGRAARVARLVAMPEPVDSSALQELGWARCPPCSTPGAAQLGRGLAESVCPVHHRSYYALITFQCEELAHWSRLPLPSHSPHHLGPKLVSSAGVGIPPASHRPMPKGSKCHSGCSHVQSSGLATARAPRTAGGHLAFVYSTPQSVWCLRVGTPRGAKRNGGFSLVLNYLPSNWYIALDSESCKFF